MIRSRAKGCRGERDAAAAWVQHVGGQARRGQQFAGGTDSPDVVCSQENVHLEVKRVERGNPYQWMEQAVRDSGTKIPVVLHRRNHQDWLVIVRLTDVRRLAEEIGGQATQVGHQTLSSPLPGPVLPATAGTNGQPPGVL